MNRTKRTFVIVVVILVLFYILSGCASQWKGDGVVTSKHYEAAYSYFMPGYQTAEQCHDITIGKETEEECTPGYYVPGHTVYVPAVYEITVQGDTHKHTIDVSEFTFSGCSIGNAYTGANYSCSSSEANTTSVTEA